MDHGARALIWLEIAGRSTAFKEQVAVLAEAWMTLAHIEKMSRRPDEAEARSLLCKDL